MGLSETEVAVLHMVALGRDGTHEQRCMELEFKGSAVNEAMA
jgi:hypothetical protein